MIDGIYVMMPAYNAEKTVESVFERIPEETREFIEGYLVVNDGSSDGTADKVEALKAKLPTLTLINHEKNKGYGGAEKTLLNAALERNAQYMILLHADGQYSPEKILEIIDVFEKQDADIVQGSRMLGGGALKGGMPFYKYFSNKCLTFLENTVLGLKMAEYHSGYMSYSRRFIEQVPFEALSNSFDFDLEMIVLAKTGDFNICEIAIPTIYEDEISHLNPIKYGMDVLKILKKYKSGYYRRLLESMKESQTK